jgi:glycoside/pentoside/hexuronide:cation symporter, GPH family
MPAALAFAATHIPIAAVVLAIGVHLPRYFASHMGLSLTLVGGAFALVRMIDIPLDPVLGLSMDRTKSRFGRYRLWTWVGVPILMGALYALIVAPEGVGRTYLIFGLLAMYVGYSILLLSNLAWAATLATSYEQRNRIFGVFTGLGVTGAVAVLIIPVVVQRMGGTDAEGVQAMLWAMLAATPVCAFLVTFRTPEPESKDRAHPEFKLRDYLTLLTRGNVVRILVADLFVTLGPGWMAAVYLFFFKDSRGFDTVEANLLLMIYIAAGFVGAPLTAWLANRISKHRALIVTTTVYSLMLLTLIVLPKGNFLAAVPTMFICGAMAAGFTVMIRAITGDIGDEIRLESGREWMGLMYALTTATTKAAGAASIFLTFNVLAAVGYQAQEGATNTPEAILGLELAYLIGPIFFVMAGGACFIGYKLTATRHGEIRAELERRDALAFDPAATLENLTAEPDIGPAPAPATRT